MFYAFQPSDQRFCIGHAHFNGIEGRALGLIFKCRRPSIPELGNLETGIHGWRIVAVAGFPFSTFARLEIIGA